MWQNICEGGKMLRFSVSFLQNREKKKKTGRFLKNKNKKKLGVGKNFRVGRGR